MNADNTCIYYVIHKGSRLIKKLQIIIIDCLRKKKKNELLATSEHGLNWHRYILYRRVVSLLFCTLDGYEIVPKYCANCEY